MERYAKGEFTPQEFVDIMKDYPIFYSLPVVQYEDGQAVGLVQFKGVSCKFYPAFLSNESCVRFYKELGCKGLIVTWGNLDSLLSCLDHSPNPAELGAVIEPSAPVPTVILPGIRVSK